MLLFTVDPALDPLERTLQGRGLAAIRVRSMRQARTLLQSRPERCVAVLEVDRDAPFSFDGVYELLHSAPAVPTLLLIDSERERDLRPWMASQYDDNARLPIPLDALALRVQALLLQSGIPSPVETTRFHQGEVIVVFGPKGGVGRSTVATNLAVGLAQLYGRHVALVDADLWFGDLRVLLDLQSDKSFATLADRADQLDLDALSDVLVPHSTGIRVLLAPQSPELVETIPQGLPARAVAAYRSLFDYVVVDTHNSMEEHTLQLLETADRILLVTTPEMSAIRQMAQVLKLAPTLGWHDRTFLVLNRANSGVQVDRLEQSLGMRVDARVVSAGPRIVDAANRGRPALLMDPAGQEEITRDLARITARVAGASEPRWSDAQVRERFAPQEWLGRLSGMFRRQHAAATRA